jgi:hypothetical protein
METANWFVSASLGLLLIYVLFVPQGRETVIYYVCLVLSIVRWGRRRRCSAYVCKESERFRASLNREVPGLIDAPLRIEYTNEETRDQFMQNGRLVVRMRDHGARHKNLSVATLLYVRGGVVPEARSYLGQTVSNAVDFTSSKILLQNHHHKDALLYFVHEVSGPATQKEPDLRKVCTELEDIERQAMLTNVFLREARDVAKYLYPRQETAGDEVEWRQFLAFLHDRATAGPGEKPPIGVSF